jgi:hypothetical protein
MRKIAFLFIASFLLSMAYSCQNKHSKAYSGLEKEIAAVEGQILEIDNCDDLQMLSFSILGLRSDLENACREQAVSEVEADELTKAVAHLDSVWQGKSSTLGCEAYFEAADELVTSEDDEYENY